MSITARYFIDLIDVQCINIQRIRMMWYNDDENDDVQEFFFGSCIDTIFKGNVNFAM